MPNHERYIALKVFVTFMLFVMCSIAAALTTSWIIWVLMLIGAYLFAEYFGILTFERWEWFQRLSVEHAGFSIMRIILGVVAVLAFVGLILLGRLLFLRLAS